MTPKTLQKPVPVRLSVQSAYSGFGNVYLFTARRFDAQTGLQYSRYRYYDPHSGRFLQRDPIDSWPHEGFGPKNLYSYVENNPRTFFDPLGLETEGVPEGIWTSLITTLQMRYGDCASEYVYVRGLCDCARRAAAKKSGKAITLVGTTLITAPYKTYKYISGAGLLERVVKDLGKKLTEEAFNKLKSNARKLFQNWVCEKRKVPEKIDPATGKKPCGCAITLCFNEALKKLLISIDGLVGKVPDLEGRGTVPCCPTLRRYTLTTESGVTEDGKGITKLRNPKVTAGNVRRK